MTGPQCSRKGCSSAATCRPVLLAYAHPRHEPARMMFPLPTCDACRAEVTIDALVDDNGWQLIVEQFQKIGRAVPRRELLRLQWEPVN